MKKLITLVIISLLILPSTLLALSVSEVNVPLHSPHVNANSETFDKEPDNGGLTDPVVWHFVLTGNYTNPAATAYITFENAGEKIVSGTQSGGGAIHFYIGTPTHDKILSGYVLVTADTYAKNPNFVLSHVSLNDNNGNGDDNGNGTDNSDNDSNGNDNNNGDTISTDEVNKTIESTTTVIDENVTNLGTTVEKEDFLPYTGGSIYVLIAAVLAAITGLGLRLYSIRG